MKTKQPLNKVQVFFKKFSDGFKVLSLGEKIAYGLIGLGALLILVSLFLF